MKNKDKNDDSRFWMSIYKLATVGLTLVASTFIGLGMGWAIDHLVFHGRTEPWFTVVFLLLGIVAGFREMYRITKRSLESEDKPGEGPGEE